MARQSGSPRIALVTGAARGIGAAVARRLSEDGMAVVLGDVDVPSAERVAAALPNPALALHMDVSSEDSIAEGLDVVRQRIGVVNRVAACAGVIHIGPFDALSRADWERTLDVNAWGTYLCFREVAKRLVAVGNPGQMVAIASIAARGPNPVAPDYGVSKAGVVNLVRSAAVVYAPHGITVNAICPGLIDTEMIHQVQDQVGNLTSRPGAAVLAERVAAIPLGRIGRPEDVAAAASFLLSGDSSYITGQALNVCGGLEFD